MCPFLCKEGNPRTIHVLFLLGSFVYWFSFWNSRLLRCIMAKSSITSPIKMKMKKTDGTNLPCFNSFWGDFSSWKWRSLVSYPVKQIVGCLPFLPLKNTCLLYNSAGPQCWRCTECIDAIKFPVFPSDVKWILKKFKFGKTSVDDPNFCQNFKY